MRKLVLTMLICCSCVVAYAEHITGGTIYYTFLDSANGNYRYQITLVLYRDHQSAGAPLDDKVNISAFDKSTNASVWNGTAYIVRSQLYLSTPGPCITSPPVIWYDIGRYEYIAELPASKAGYTIAYQRCWRISSINNLYNSNSTGATYTAEIPGTALLADAPANNSAQFTGIDTVIVCAKNQFCYDFGAVDYDRGDSLSYNFCNSYNGSAQNNIAPLLPGPPPYESVQYADPYRAENPLGNQVTIDPKTGMMCGIAPAAGIYVVTVCVNEYRKGVLIATQRKDLQIKVGDCNVPKASLLPSYPTCDSFTRTFANEAPPNPAIHNYYWDFGIPNDPNAKSTLPNPTYTYPDTGLYVLTLIVNKGEQCADTAYSVVKVYPGFFPGFIYQGVCEKFPTGFKDTSKVKYGVVNSWKWDFGDPLSNTDFSQQQNPTYQYPMKGTYPARLIVTSSKGCIDTIYKNVAISNKPPVGLTFKDTLICLGDQLQLHATGYGTFIWTPAGTMTGANTASPTVSPTSTQIYIAQINDNGCANSDTVQVRVINSVSLQARSDTSICLKDSIQLFAISDGLKFQWSPSTDFNNPTAQNPIVRPSGSNNVYTVKAMIGGCTTSAEVKIRTVAYPLAEAGTDTTVCYGSSVRLHATIRGSSFSWSPANSLLNFNTVDPVASPKNDTNVYILTVFDTLGCPKPAYDTVVVIRNPRIIASGGNDTSVVVGQVLQLNATGSSNFVWKPATGLSNPNIPNPVGHYDGSFDSITYQVNTSSNTGCSDSAYVTVRIFKTDPRIFVPTAFTPNGDSKNDSFRPIAAGIGKILYFRVFNRWGQLMFETTQNGKGWNGTVNGKEQPSGVYVWITKGIDYLGNEFFAKGSTVLIR